MYEILDDRWKINLNWAKNIPLCISFSKGRSLGKLFRKIFDIVVYHNTSYPSVGCTLIFWMMLILLFWSGHSNCRRDILLEILKTFLFVQMQFVKYWIRFNTVSFRPEKSLIDSRMYIFSMWNSWLFCSFTHTRM